MHRQDRVKTSSEPEAIHEDEHGVGLFVTDGEPSSPSPSPERSLPAQKSASGNSGIEVRAPRVVQKSDYVVFLDEWKVTRVLEELSPGLEGELRYDVEFADGHTTTVSRSIAVFCY
jgi:hypothetical protein